MVIYTVKRATASGSDVFVMCSSRAKAIYAVLDNDKILAISWDNGDVCIEKSKVSLNDWVNYIARLASGSFDHRYPLVFIAQNCSYTIDSAII